MIAGKNPAELAEDVIRSHQVMWNGLGKYLWQTVNVAAKAVKIPGFGTIGP